MSAAIAVLSILSFCAAVAWYGPAQRGAERVCWWIAGRFNRLAARLAARQHRREVKVKPFRYPARVVRFPVEKEARDEDLMRWLRGENVH